MKDPATAREALIAVAIGDAVRVVRQMEDLAKTVDRQTRALLDADAQLRETLSGVEGRIAAITDVVRSRAGQQLATRLDETTRALDRAAAPGDGAGPHARPWAPNTSRSCGACRTT